MSARILDRLRIRDLRARCVIGVYPRERRQPQDVIINISLHADLRRAGRTDRLEDSVDYKRVKLAILAFVEGSAFRLLERLAEGIADICLADPRVRRADVSVQKPGALRFARCSEVEITREQAARRRRPRRGAEERTSR